MRWAVLKWMMLQIKLVHPLRLSHLSKQHRAFRFSHSYLCFDMKHLVFMCLMRTNINETSFFSFLALYNSLAVCFIMGKRFWSITRKHI